MQVKLKIDVPVTVESRKNARTGDVTISVNITLSEDVQRVLGQGGLATVESALRLAVEDSMPGFFEGGD